MFVIKFSCITWR